MIGAYLTSASLTAIQARKVELGYGFSRRSKSFSLLLSRRTSSKWAKVRLVSHRGSFSGSHIESMHTLFGMNVIRVGQYRLRLSADGNHVTLPFEIIATTPLAKVTAVTAGGIDGCALSSAATVACWGYDGEGQLGNGKTINSSPYGIPTATQVRGLKNVAVLSTGLLHTCALLGGAVKCWGNNRRGQLGDSSNVNSSTPIAVTGLVNAILVSAGGFHSCALLSDGTVDCWGYDRAGQLGNGAATDSSTPVAVAGLANATSISAGGYHSCAILGSGAIDCWGDNEYGQLGNGQVTNSATPVAVSGITDAVSVSTGSYHTCAVLKAGTVYCWGFNLFGQLGQEGMTDQSTPQMVSGITDAVSVSAGGFHTCVLLRSGSVECWGESSYGQLGNGRFASDSATPVVVKGIQNATAVSAGFLHSCARLRTGTIKCWGSNHVGELGDGTTLNSSIPVDVSVLK